MVDEEYICNLVIKMLSKDKVVDNFKIEHRTPSYTTLAYGNNDFFRIKYTDRAKWLSIRLAPSDRNENDERFNAQTKKSQFHWKANIYSDQDIYRFEKELSNACTLLREVEPVIYQPKFRDFDEMFNEFMDKHNKTKGK